MNGVLLEKIASAGSDFLVWHFLTLIICVTGLLLERGQREGNSHVRSSLLRLTLLLALAVPLVCAIGNELPASSNPVPTTQEKPEPVAVQQPLSEFPPFDWNHVAVWRPMIADLGQLQDHLATNTSFGLPLLQVFYGTILTASSIVSLFLLARLVWAIFHCVALRRRGKPLEGSEEARCRVVASALGVPAPQVLQVDGLESPLLLGFFKTVILLPNGIQVRDEIYSHELTHLRRRDMWWHLFACLATILMPLQPGFWLLKKALERADEDVCDEMVLVCGANRSAYAEFLLKVAEAQHSPNPALCLPMAAFRSQLERRLHRLMDTARPPASRLSLSSLVLCLAPLLVVGVLAGAIYLDAQRPLLAAEKDSAPDDTSLLKTDYTRFLAYAAPYDKGAMAKGFKAADEWLALLDEEKYSTTPAPDYLNGDPISAQGWQEYLNKTYSHYGKTKARELKTMVPGVNGAANPIVSYLLLEYETEFQGRHGAVMLGEDLFLGSGSDGKWRVVKLLTFTPTEPKPAYHGPTPVIRTIGVEFVGLPPVPKKEMEVEIVAESGLKISTPCQIAQLHRAVKNIFATGKVTNIAIKAQPAGGAVNVAIVVQPNPTVKQVNFQGISAEEEAKLRPRLQTKEGAIGSDYLVFSDARLITSELTKQGLHLVTTDTTTTLDPYRNGSCVTFKITSQ